MGIRDKTLLVSVKFDNKLFVANKSFNYTSSAKRKACDKYKRKSLADKLAKFTLQNK